GISSAERWDRETRYHVEDIGTHLNMRPESLVLDYGCGLGRLAKELIETYHCRVIGVDQSRSMCLLAPGYVLSERFTVWLPMVLDKMIAGGFRVDAAICLWVIQHAADPLKTIERIRQA